MTEEDIKMLIETVKFYAKCENLEFIKTARIPNKGGTFIGVSLPAEETLFIKDRGGESSRNFEKIKFRWRITMSAAKHRLNQEIWILVWDSKFRKFVPETEEIANVIRPVEGEPIYIMSTAHLVAESETFETKELAEEEALIRLSLGQKLDLDKIKYVRQMYEKYIRGKKG